MRIAYPGSFDPITEGHLDIIRRSMALCSELHLLIGDNTRKNYLFTAEERLAIVEEALSEEGLQSRCQVATFKGLLVDEARARGVSALVRGLRVISDFETELQFTNAQKHLAKEIEIIFLPSSLEHTYISSSLVKEIAELGGTLKGLAPSASIKALCKKYPRN